MTHFVLPSLHVTPSPSYKTTLAKRPAPSSKAGIQGRYSAIEPLSRYIKTVGDFVSSLRDGLSEAEREHRRRLEERKLLLSARLQNAETYAHWEAAAHELDVLEGHEEWKAEVSSGDYNPDLIEERLEALDQARQACDLRAMMHLVRTSLSRDLGGMGNIDLYRHSHCGTKKLIERYVDSALKTITALVSYSSHALPDDLEPKDVLDAVLFARQSFGRSALLLSGGGTFGMTHIGVLKALFEVKLLPRIISGASAGSIVCAVVCTRTDDEIPELIAEFPYGDLDVFEEEGNEDGLIDHVRRLLTHGNWSDIRHLTRVMRNLLGDMTFQEAYNRSRRICNICVSSASIYELPRLLNYVTAPNVMIWSAVAASCSVPLVFSAAPLLVKDPLTGEHMPWNPTPQMWIDGSVDNDLPMTRLAEMFNVNHFIVSQVNPHVVPFLSKDDTLPPTPSPPGPPMAPTDETDWMHTLMQLAKSETLHRMQFLAEIGILPNLVSKLRAILSQKYSGDINILPAIGVTDLPRILKNPTMEFMLRSCLLGERATWPKLSRVRDRCAIELALDRAVHALRARVVFSRSQVDLRRMAAGSLGNPFPPEDREPLHALGGQGDAPGTIPRDKPRHRQRRSSVTHMQMAPHHRRLADDDSKLTDVDTDEEERLEMHPRRTGLKKQPQLKLKRHGKDSPLRCGPMTTPVLSSVNNLNAFDFAQPPTPARGGLDADVHTHADSLTPTPTPGFGSRAGHRMASRAEEGKDRAYDAAHATQEPDTSRTASDADPESQTDECGEEARLGMTSDDGAQEAWLHEIGRRSRAMSPDMEMAGHVFALTRRERNNKPGSLSDAIDAPGAGSGDGDSGGGDGDGLWS